MDSDIVTIQIPYFFPMIFCVPIESTLNGVFKFYLYITNDVNICSFYSSFTGVFFFGNAFHSKKSTNYRCFSGSNFISMFYLNWHRNIVQSETTKPVREKNFNFLNVYFGVMFGFALTFICFIECIALNHTNNS